MIANINSGVTSFDPEFKRLITECSMMGFTAGMGYPTAIVVESRNTGRKVTFEPIIDYGNMSKFVIYQPTEECGVNDLVVYND